MSRTAAAFPGASVNSRHWLEAEYPPMLGPSKRVSGRSREGREILCPLEAGVIKLKA